MKRKLAIVVAMIFFSAGAAAGGPADLTGCWSGQASSIVCCPTEESPDCSTLTINTEAYISISPHSRSMPSNLLQRAKRTMFLS